MFINGLSGNLLASINRQIVVTKVTAVGAIVNVGLNFLMIPKFSYIGASITTVATEFTVLLILIYVLSKTEYKIRMSLVKDVVRIVISILPIVILIKYLDNINLILLIILCIFVYCGTLYTTKALNKKDISMMKSLLMRENESKHEKK
jgi:O-antigen/teichoic acid export membrane protein